MNKPDVEQLKRIRDEVPDETTNINLAGTPLRIDDERAWAFYGDKNKYAVNTAISSDLVGVRSLSDINTIIELAEENEKQAAEIDALKNLATSLSSELYTAITEVNHNLTSNITPHDSEPPNYWDFESCFNADMFVKSLSDNKASSGIDKSEVDK